mmetsp:Transcript_5327/g.10423  ORF Transcript_5327/g.10423 Transcript_5327/m.10423 type:complete len:149 (+) Transcript_5327:280-726(+)
MANKQLRDTKGEAEYEWLKGVAVAGVAASRVNLRVVTFYTMQGVARLNQLAKEARLIRFTKRFSEFLEMHYNVSKWYARNFPEINLPEHPPKNSMSFFSKHSSTFLNERKTKLESYIQSMAKVPHMSRCTVFLEFINATHDDANVLVK